MSSIKFCILEDNKKCTNCQECHVCDLDVNKICDNCCKCLDGTIDDYETIVIDDIII